MKNINNQSRGITSLLKTDEKFASDADQTELQKPKVVLFGDSISSAVGYGTDSKADTKYGNTVADILSEQLGAPVDLQAVGGATTKDALTSNYLPGGTYEQYLKENRPDVVLLRFGAADAIRLNDPEQTLTNLQSMIDLAKSYGATPVMIGVSPFAPGNDIRAGNIIDWSIDPYISSANVINQGMQQIASNNQLPFIDMQKLEVPKGALLDGVHPTADFGKTMANYIGQSVSAAVPQFGGSFEGYQKAATPAPSPFTAPPLADTPAPTPAPAFAPTPAPTPTSTPAQQAGLASLLPSGWSGYGAEQKIDWFNQNKVTPEQLLGAGAGVTQQDIDWMRQHGYRGTYAPQTFVEPKPAQSTTRFSAFRAPLEQVTNFVAQPTIPTASPTPPLEQPFRTSSNSNQAQQLEAIAKAQALSRAGVPMPEEYRKGGRVRII